MTNAQAFEYVGRVFEELIVPLFARYHLNIVIPALLVFVVAWLAVSVVAGWRAK